MSSIGDSDSGFLGGCILSEDLTGAKVSAPRKAPHPSLGRRPSFLANSGSMGLLNTAAMIREESLQDGTQASFITESCRDVLLLCPYSVGQTYQTSSVQRTTECEYQGWGSLGTVSEAADHTISQTKKLEAKGLPLHWVCLLWVWWTRVLLGAFPTDTMDLLTL